MSLLPDENQREELELPRRNQETTQPYGWAAAIVGLLALLISRAGLQHASPLMPWSIAIVVGLLVYQILLAARPKLPLMAMSVVIAELALLLSLPSNQIFHPLWLNAPTLLNKDSPAVEQLSSMISCLIAAGTLGAFIGWAFSVERYPTLVLSINFLAIFVLVNLGYALLF